MRKGEGAKNSECRFGSVKFHVNTRMRVQLFLVCLLFRIQYVAFKKQPVCVSRSVFSETCTY